MNPHQAQEWLLSEGLLPLFGPGLVFVVWGSFRWISATDKKSFSYAWKEAIDPFGWLYVAASIAAASALRLLKAADLSGLTAFCGLAALACLGLLAAAMTERAEHGGKPARELSIAAFFLVAVVLAAGYYVQRSANAQPNDGRTDATSSPLPARGGADSGAEGGARQ